MTEDNQAKFEGWAKVEVMGHQSHIGKVTTQAFGQAVMFRVDSPEIPEREETLLESRWTGSGRFEKGSVIKHGAIPATTVLVGAGSIYRIIPCTEELAIQSIIGGQTAPIQLVSVPARMISEPQSLDLEGDFEEPTYQPF